MVRLTFREKSSYFNRKYRFIRLLFAYSIFKNIKILSGQDFVQIEPKVVWRILCVGGEYNAKNFCYSFSRKKVCISYGNLRNSRLANFNYSYF